MTLSKDELHDLTRVVYQQFDAYAARERLRPSSKLREAFRPFIEDCLGHAFTPTLEYPNSKKEWLESEVVQRRKAENYVQRTTPKIVEWAINPILASLLKVCGDIPRLPEGPFKAQFDLSADAIQSLIWNFMDTPIQDYELYYNLRKRLNDNAAKAKHTFPRNNRDASMYDYFKETPLVHASPAHPVSFREFTNVNHFFVGHPRGGKTTHLLATVWDHIQQRDAPMLILDPQGELTDELEPLQHWETDDRLVVVEPAAHPAMNPFDRDLTPTAAAGVAQMYDYLFQEADMTRLQSGTFYPIILMLLAKHQREGADISDIFDFLWEPTLPRWKPYIDAIPDRHIRTTLERSVVANTRTQTRDGLIARMETINTEPALKAALSARENKVDLYKLLHEEKKIVLVNARGLNAPQTFMRFIMLQVIRMAYKRDALHPSKRFPIPVFIDEAPMVFTTGDVTKSIITQCRKFGVFLRAYTQGSEFFQDPGVFNTLLEFSDVKYAVGVMRQDVPRVTSAMGSCEEDDVTFRLPANSDHVEFAAFIDGVTKKPFLVSHVKGALKHLPRSTPDIFASLAATRRRALQSQHAAPRRDEPQDDAELDPRKF
jgi:hypothetical protein